MVYKISYHYHLPSFLSQLIEEAVEVLGFTLGSQYLKKPQIMALWMFIPHLFTLSVVPEQNEMASGNGTTKLAVWSGWWCVISRKSSAAGTSWSVLTAWWHPTALCASSGKCAVYPQGSQIIGSEELKTGTICQITEHMRLPVSTVSLIQHVSDLKQILQPISAKRPKGVGCGVLFFLKPKILNSSEGPSVTCWWMESWVQHLSLVPVLP